VLIKTPFAKVFVLYILKTFSAFMLITILPSATRRQKRSNSLMDPRLKIIIFHRETKRESFGKIRNPKKSLTFVAYYRRLVSAVCTRRIIYAPMSGKSIKPFYGASRALEGKVHYHRFPSTCLIILARAIQTFEFYSVGQNVKYDFISFVARSIVRVFAPWNCLTLNILGH
jgi:hypothetical protein